MSHEPKHFRRGGRRGMRRRDFLAAIGGTALSPRIARAQQGRLPTIGHLYAGSLGRLGGAGGHFRRGLAEMGYVEGRNVTFVSRGADNDLARLPELARGLVRRAVDVIVVQGSMPAALAAKAATATIPIVFANAGDPIKAGLVTNLSRPDGNITGISDFGVELSAKRLELIKLLVPDASTLAMLMAPDNLRAGRELAHAREGARSLGIEIVVLPASTAQEIDAAFVRLAQERAEALCVSPNALYFDHRAQIVALATRHRIPTVYPFIQFAEIGGLMSYGSSLAERSYQAGIYAGLILNGRTPADLPIRRITRFELALNLTNAKTLGLTVPPAFLALADKVIE